MSVGLEPPAVATKYTNRLLGNVKGRIAVGSEFFTTFLVFMVAVALGSTATPTAAPCLITNCATPFGEMSL